MNDQHEEARNLEIQPTDDPIVGTVRLGRSPVSDIIENVWRGAEEPPKKTKRNRRVKAPQNGKASQITLSESGEVAVRLSPEQLIAVFDGLKLLLAELAAANPQPLQPIYVVTDAIRRLEQTVLEQVRLTVEEKRKAT